MAGVNNFNIQTDSTFADIVVLKLQNLHEEEGANEFLHNHTHTYSAPGGIPYIHLDPSATTICLSWKMPEPWDFESYIFIEKIPASSPKIPDRARERHFTYIESVDGIFQYLFTNLLPGKTFIFRIKAFNCVGQEGPFSPWVETSTLYLSPSPPDLSCVEWTNNSLTLSWQNVPKEDIDILHYVIEMQTAMGTFKKIYEGPKTKFKLIMLEADTEYHFRICAFDQSKKRKGPYSTRHTFSTSFRLIGNPNLLIKAIGLRKYNNEYMQHCEYIPSAIWGHLNMRSSCKYERTALCVQNFDEMIRFALSPIPSSITNVCIFSLINAFYLSWREPTFNSCGIRSYNIEFQALPLSNNRYLLNTKENIKDIFLINLDAGTTYNIRLQAVNEFGPGYFTEMLQVATLHKIPQSPELKCIPGETYLELVWDIEDRNGVLSYTVELQGVYGFYAVYQGPSYNCILDKLEPNTEYFFRISAFCSAGRSDYSRLYCFKTLSPLYNPQIHGCESSDDESKDSEKEVVRFFPPAKRLLKFKFTYHPSTEKSGVELCSNDFNTLNPSTFLNDAVIEFYLKYLYCERLTEMEKEKTYIFSSFFFSKLIKFGKCPDDFPPDEFQRRRHDSVKTWTRRCDIFSKNFLIFPINQFQHWMVAIICFPGLAPDVCDRPGAAEHYNLNDENSASSSGNSETEERNPCICIFDSFHKYSMATIPDVRNYGTVLREYLDSEWSLRKGTKKLFNKYTMPAYYVNCPQQPNGFDCGIFMLQNTETFFEKQIPYFEEDRLDSKSWFSNEKASGKRLEIQKLMLEMLDKI